MAVHHTEQLKRDIRSKSPVVDRHGNPLKSGSLLGRDTISPEEKKAREEFKDKLKNRWWRLNNLYYIVDEKSRRRRFVPNWAQRLLMKNMWYLNIILKARQLGFTTFICILFLDTCLFRKDTHCAIIAHNREDAEEFFNNKVKYAYNNLPEWFRDEMNAPTDSTKKLSFSNGSSIRVTTSGRSGTFYMLHISEFGKVCARYPEKAREIVTGALNTVHAGQYVFIESTAEGNQGRFFEMCKLAKDMLLRAIKLNKMQYKFHFYPWWANPNYQLDDDVPTPDDMQQYFDELLVNEEFVEYWDKFFPGTEPKLTRKQMNWYTMKAAEQAEDMKREFPSTPTEAFEASVVGAYFAKEMTKIRKQKRITTVPWDPMYAVNVFFDIGYNDNMALWFHQYINGRHCFIRYFEGSGEGIQYYIDYMKQMDYIYGTIFMPHDGRNHSPQTGESFEDYARKLKIPGRIEIVERAKNSEEVNQGIQASRNMLGKAWFDEELCDKGLKHLDNYKKKWDKNLEQFQNKPLHNAASNGADAFRCGAVGFKAEVEYDESDLVPEYAEDV